MESIDLSPRPHPIGQQRDHFQQIIVVDDPPPAEGVVGIERSSALALRLIVAAEAGESFLRGSLVLFPVMAAAWLRAVAALTHVDAAGAAEAPIPDVVLRRSRLGVSRRSFGGLDCDLWGLLGV